MYYEEKLIDGILHWRGTPDGGWQIIPAEKLSERVTAAEAFRATVADALTELRAEMVKLSKTVEGNLKDDPSCDEEHDYNAGCRGIIKGISECAIKLDATITKLELEAAK